MGRRMAQKGGIKLFFRGPPGYHYRLDLPPLGERLPIGGPPKAQPARNRSGKRTGECGSALESDRFSIHRRGGCAQGGLNSQVQRTEGP